MYNYNGNNLYQKYSVGLTSKDLDGFSDDGRGFPFLPMSVLVRNTLISHQDKETLCAMQVYDIAIRILKKDTTRLMKL